MTTLADVLAAHWRVQKAEEDLKALRKRFAEEAAPFKPGDTIPERKVQYSVSYLSTPQVRVDKALVVKHVSLSLYNDEVSWHFTGHGIKKDGSPGVSRVTRSIPAREDELATYMASLHEAVEA